MHVRLLDMGMVNVLRSQSIYHAICSTMTADSDPAIIILRPEGHYISINNVEDDKSVHLENCKTQKIPVIRRQIAQGNYIHNENQLFLSFLFPKSLDNQFANIEKLSQAVILAYNKLGIAVQLNQYNCFEIGNKEIGVTSLGQLNNIISFFCSISLDEMTITDPRLFLPSQNNLYTSVSEETGSMPSLERSAEALLSSFEEFFKMALIPSMPTPEEMDAIYEWDTKLLNNEKLNSNYTKNLSGSLN